MASQEGSAASRNRHLFPVCQQLLLLQMSATDNSSSSSALITFALYRQHGLPTATDLHLDTITGLHGYSSAPEAGRPSLPFHDDPQRKTDREPFFGVPEDDDNNEDDEKEEKEEEEDIVDAGTPQVPDIPTSEIPDVSAVPPPQPPQPQVVKEDIPVEIKKGAQVPQEPVTVPAVQAHKKPISPDLVALDPTKVALLLETRPQPHLPALLTHFISVLPLDWTFRFVGSPSSLALINRSTSLQHHIKTGKLVLSDLPKKYAINTQEAISATLADLSFYKEFLAPAEWLLVFQSDSIVCSASDHSIEDYVSKGYTWVGAPWNLDNKSGGNGGLSLRHIPPIIKVLESEKRKAHSHWEDRWLCDRLQRSDATNMPPPEVERHFSVEGIWTERPFGYHLRGGGKLKAEDIWDNAYRRKAIFEYCPEIKIVLDMELTDEINDVRKELAELKKQIINHSAKILGVSNRGAVDKAVEKVTGESTNGTAAKDGGNKKIH